MKGLDKRVAQAIAQDPSIISSWDDLDSARGRSLAEMAALGLDKRDLKWMERRGLAIRAYTANGNMEYRTDPVTGMVSQRRCFAGGSRTKWIIFIDTKKGEDSHGQEASSGAGV